MHKTSFRVWLYLLTALILGSYIPTLAAKTVTLYEQPVTSSKSVGSLDLKTGVIPIYTPQNSDWVKVADPRNGNVGWIKSSDLNSNGTTSFSFTQRVQDGEKNPPATTQVFQFGSKPVSQVEMQKYLNNLEIQQMQIQQSTEKTTRELMNNLNKIYLQQIEFLKGTVFPTLMPGVVMPMGPTEIKTTPAPNASSTQPSTSVTTKTTTGKQ